MSPSRPSRPRSAGGTRRSPGAPRPGPHSGRGAGKANRPMRSGSSTRGRAAREGGEAAPPRPTLTLRSVGLFIVILVAFIVLAPTLRHAVEQQEQLRRVTAEVAAAQQRTAELEEELARWQDDDFVKAQARDRLGFVMPGERTYRVIDPHTIVGEDAQDDDGNDGALPEVDSAPWYLRVWDSVDVAGHAAEEDEAADPAG
ncbi:MAG TPA: septum formation initiator family protein [Actinomycetaceae bacterium]|nr:septum formation initiator family protein [Actinomycetaceae bacterium]